MIVDFTERDVRETALAVRAKTSLRAALWDLVRHADSDEDIQSAYRLKPAACRALADLGVCSAAGEGAGDLRDGVVVTPFGLAVWDLVRVQGPLS